MIIQNQTVYFSTSDLCKRTESHHTRLWVSIKYWSVTLWSTPSVLVRRSGGPYLCWVPLLVVHFGWGHLMLLLMVLNQFRFLLSIHCKTGCLVTDFIPCTGLHNHISHNCNTTQTVCYNQYLNHHISRCL